MEKEPQKQSRPDSQHEAGRLRDGTISQASRLVSSALGVSRSKLLVAALGGVIRLGCLGNLHLFAASNLIPNSKGFTFWSQANFRRYRDLIKQEPP